LTQSECISRETAVYKWYCVHCCYAESFKSAGITVSHFFSMLPSTLKYLYSVEPVRMHFPVYKWYCVHCCYAALHTVSFVHGKMHSDWFNGIEILQSRWQHGEKVGYCYPSGLERLFLSGTYMSRWSRKGKRFDFQKMFYFLFKLKKKFLWISKAVNLILISLWLHLEISGTNNNGRTDSPGLIFPWFFPVLPGECRNNNLTL